MSSKIPGLSWQRLGNGLDAIVVENRAVPLVTLEIAVKSGAYVETPDLAGLSHLYEHMFFKGNRVLSNQERYLERLRELGASWNGTTGTERVNYFITVPSENLRDGAVFLRDALLYPLFLQRELERERIVVLGEFDRAEATPGWHLHHQTDRKLWYRYLSRKVPIGDRAMIERATRQQMLTLQERYYVPNNTAVLFGGDVEPEEAFGIAAELFGPAVWPRSEDPHAKYPEPVHPPLEGSSMIAVIQPVQTATIQMSWHGPGMLADTASTFAADVLGFIVNQPTSRFHKRLIDTGLLDGAAMNYYSQVHTGPISVTGVTSTERLDRARAAMLVELERMADADAFSDEELEFAKNQMEVSEIYSRERPTEFVHSVSFWWATGGLDYYESYLDNLRRVSRADIQAYLRQYVLGRPSVTGLLLSESDLGRVAFAAEAEVIRPPKGSSATAIASLKRKGQQTELFELDGLRVLLRRNDASEVVTVKTFLDGGLALATPERAGRELLVLQVAEKASERYPKEAMARELTRLGADLYSDAQADHSTFSLRAIRRNLARSLELYLDALLHPALEEEETALARDRRLTSLGAEEQTPDARLGRLALEAVYGDHPFALNPLGTRERIAAVRAPDLRAEHERCVGRARMLLVVVGDVERDELERLLESALRDLPAGSSQSPAMPAVAQRPPGVVTEDRDLPTVYLEGSFLAPNVRHPDYPALYLGMVLLHDRLFDEIRTKRNLSYAPGSVLRRRSVNIGQVYVTSVEPNQCAELMFESIRELQKAPLSESKVRNAANETRTRLMSSLQTSGDIAAWMGDFQLHGGGWEQVQSFFDALGHVTPEEARAAMERHVKGFRFAALGHLEGLDSALLTSF